MPCHVSVAVFRGVTVHVSIAAAVLYSIQAQRQIPVSGMCTIYKPALCNLVAPTDTTTNCNIDGQSGLKLCQHLPQGGSMIEHKYPTAFPLKHQQKDMRLALELAEQHGQELPTAAAANQLYGKVSVQSSSCECLYTL